MGAGRGVGPKKKGKIFEIFEVVQENQAEETTSSFASCGVVQVIKGVYTK